MADLSIDTLINKMDKDFQSGIGSLKEIDSLLHKIAQTDITLSMEELSKIAADSYKISGKYGKSASEYLSAVLTLSEAGYKNAAALAELSISSQAAGNMAADMADQYLMAADKAYRLSGNVDALKNSLDGISRVASSLGISMEELTGAMTASVSSAASQGIDAGRTAAALGAIMKATGQDGQAAANTLKEILAGCTADLESFQTGAALFAGESINKASDAAFDQLVQQYNSYQDMIQVYYSGLGGLKERAAVAANSWEGSLNRMSDTWTNVVANIVDPHGIAMAVDNLNSFLAVIRDVTEALGSERSMGILLGAVLGAKNLGRTAPVRRLKTCLLFRICPPYPRNDLFQGQGCAGPVTPRGSLKQTVIGRRCRSVLGRKKIYGIS